MKVLETATATDTSGESQNSGEVTCKIKSTNATPPGENNKSADCDNTDNKQDNTDAKTDEKSANTEAEKSTNSEADKSTKNGESGKVGGVETLFLPEGWRSMQCR